MSNNLEKKLDALIDALGFDVEETDTQQRMYSKDDVDDKGQPKENAIPTHIFINSEYKLTKKVSQLDEDVEAVKYLLNQFKKGTHQDMTLKYNGKSYTYNDKWELTIENI